MSEQEQQDQIRESVQHIADRAAKQAVAEMLTHLGIDAKDPIKTQAEFQAVRKVAKLLEDEEVMDDFAFIRRLRKTSDAVRSTTTKSIVSWAVPALLGLLALLTKDWWLAHVRG